MSPAPLPVHDDLSGEIPVTPSLERWRAMSLEARDAHILEVQAALERTQDLMSQGRPHAIARSSALSVLGDWFRRVGRRMYLASELPVLYPDEAAFEPDLLAVRDVDDPGDADTRMAWVVADEGRGPDLTMEILYRGSREKDLVTNVARYARLGVPEYFVYDRLRQRLYGYRLPNPAARRYESIPSRSGALWSGVLGLDLRIVDQKLSFFHGEAALPEARELIDRLSALLDQRTRQIEGEVAEREAMEQRIAAEREGRELAEARAEEEARARAALEARVAELLARLGEG